MKTKKDKYNVLPSTNESALGGYRETHPSANPTVPPETQRDLNEQQVKMPPATSGTAQVGYPEPTRVPKPSSHQNILTDENSQVKMLPTTKASAHVGYPEHTPSSTPPSDLKL